ncbi:MAG: DUF4342 domain-containing protein [Clostridiaceae bacterium]|nr:DUF4342 domain-containing protein [Clostridiaceae bacterium]
MSISFEKIEELRKRANISYEEAKVLLEKHNGDIVEALIELEKSKRIRNDGTTSFYEKLRRLFIKGNRTKFIVTYKGETVVNVPVNYLILALLFSIHFMVFSLIIIFITGCRMTIKKPEGTVMDVDDAIVDVSERVKRAAKSFTEDKPSSKVNLEKKGEDGYNEHTIE